MLRTNEYSSAIVRSAMERFPLFFQYIINVEDKVYTIAIALLFLRTPHLFAETVAFKLETALIYRGLLLLIIIY
jgi:hypothetical protein